MKKYGLWIVAFAILGFIAWKMFGGRTPSNAGPRGTTTGSGGGVPTVPTPYNAAAIKDRQDRFTAATAAEYIGAAGALATGIKGLFGGSSNSTGTPSPVTSGSGTASPVLYDSIYDVQPTSGNVTDVYGAGDTFGNTDSSGFGGDYYNDFGY